MSEVDLLVEAFCAEFVVVDTPKKRFGSPSLRLRGLCDGAEGVQWNAWVDWRWSPEPMAYVGVNLEGLKYDGWPVGRLISRELQAPRLFDAIALIREPERVEVLWFRDAWQFSSRPVIKEKLIGPSPVRLDRLTSKVWTSMLKEAAECLGPDFRGRTKQVVTPKRGPTEFDVSPHLQFRRSFWPSRPESSTSWRTSIKESIEPMRPLYDFAMSRAAK